MHLCKNVYTLFSMPYFEEWFCFATIWSCVHFSCVGSNAGAFFNLYQELKRRNVKMEDYKKLYYELFNELSDLIEELKEIQRVAEEHFISQGEE